VAPYRYVARKVSRAKWQPPEDGSGRKATADGVTACLKTSGNTLSLWRFHDKSDLAEIALAMVANAERVEAIDLAWLDASILDRYAHNESLGHTPVTDLQSRHIDLCRLDGRQLLDFADSLFDAIQASNSERYSLKQLIGILHQAVKDGRIVPDQLKEKVRQELASSSPTPR